MAPIPPANRGSWPFLAGFTSTCRVFGSMASMLHARPENVIVVPTASGTALGRLPSVRPSVRRLYWASLF